MKHGIFISYSDNDKDKVALIVNELKGHTNLFPIVIASNREALKPLAEKVADGIIQAKIILPILTKNSISTQWINQEIGFATALSKRIMPIVEGDLIDKLKGFIHKQIDLPYNYQPNSNRATEHKNFVKQVRNLLVDLEEEFKKADRAIALPVKSDYEKSLEQADLLNRELEFHSQRNEFLNSINGIDAAKKEVINMIMDIEEKIKKLQEKKFHFDIQKVLSQPLYILKSGGYSFSIIWKQQYNNSNEFAFLHVTQNRGNLFNARNTFYLPGNEPKMISDIKYTFEIKRNNEPCWLNQKDKKIYDSVQIVDTSINWLVDQVR